MIKKIYKTKQDVLNALENLINIYEKSLYNAITNPSVVDLKNITVKLKETKLVKEEISKMNLKDLEDGYTYNLVIRQKDDKVYHTLTIEKNNIVENEFILPVESN